MFAFPVFPLIYRFPIPMAVSCLSQISLSPSFMCILCEWTTEQSYASAGYQTFTSRGTLEPDKDCGERRG